MRQAVKFFNHSDAMVRTSVKNIILNLLKSRTILVIDILTPQDNNPKLMTYVTRFPFLCYFVNLCCRLKDLWIKLDEKATQSTTDAKSVYAIKRSIEEVTDFLHYIDDR